jgi:hypothetical protein
MIRRLLGILIVASMAHLVVAGNDLVCATHGAHAAAPESQAAMPNMHHHGDGGDSGRERCKIPVRNDCCEAMTSCAANAALAVAIDENGGASSDARLVAFLSDAPLTRLVPPEPPPPKA